MEIEDKNQRQYSKFSNNTKKQKLISLPKDQGVPIILNDRYFVAFSGICLIKFDLIENKIVMTKRISKFDYSPINFDNFFLSSCSSILIMISTDNEDSIDRFARIILREDTIDDYVIQPKYFSKQKIKYKVTNSAGFIDSIYFYSHNEKNLKIQIFLCSLNAKFEIKKLCTVEANDVNFARLFVLVKFSYLSSYAQHPSFKILDQLILFSSSSKLEKPFLRVGIIVVKRSSHGILKIKDAKQNNFFRETNIEWEEYMMEKLDLLSYHTAIPNENDFDWVTKRAEKEIILQNVSFLIGFRGRQVLMNLKHPIVVGLYFNSVVDENDMETIQYLPPSLNIDVEVYFLQTKSQTFIAGAINHNNKIKKSSLKYSEYSSSSSQLKYQNAIFKWGFEIIYYCPINNKNKRIIPFLSSNLLKKTNLFYAILGTDKRQFFGSIIFLETSTGIVHREEIDISIESQSSHSLICRDILKYGDKQNSEKKSEILSDKNDKSKVKNIRYRFVEILKTIEKDLQIVSRYTSLNKEEGVSLQFNKLSVLVKLKYPCSFSSIMYSKPKLNLCISTFDSFLEDTEIFLIDFENQKQSRIINTQINANQIELDSLNICYFDDSGDVFYINLNHELVMINILESVSNPKMILKLMKNEIVYFSDDATFYKVNFNFESSNGNDHNKQRILVDHFVISNRTKADIQDQYCIDMSDSIDKGKDIQNPITNQTNFIYYYFEEPQLRPPKLVQVDLMNKGIQSIEFGDLIDKLNNSSEMNLFFSKDSFSFVNTEESGQHQLFLYHIRGNKIKPKFRNMIHKNSRSLFCNSKKMISTLGEFLIDDQKGEFIDIVEVEGQYSFEGYILKMIDLGPEVLTKEQMEYDLRFFKSQSGIDLSESKKKYLEQLGNEIIKRRVKFE